MQSGETPSVNDKFENLGLPQVSDMSLQLEQLVQQGVITPEDAKAALVGQSEMNGITLDPKLKQAQLDALTGLQDIGDGGMTDMDRANLAQISSDEDSASRGAREAILQNAQARGMGGSGLELMAQLKNQQDSATRKSSRDTQVAGMAQQRALEALMQAGQLGGQIGAQDFGQQSQIAQANDAISKFNAQNQQAVNMANTQARNDAQAANLAAKQGVADANVNMRNQQQQYNKGLLQQNFNNEMAKRGGQNQVAQQNAQIAGQNSQNRANAQNQTIGIGAGIVSGGLSAAAQQGAGAAANSGGNRKATPNTYGGQAYQQDGVYYAKSGGLVPGHDMGGDSMPAMLRPGEFVVRKEDVPEMLKKAHTDDKGEFDAAGFLDAITGHKYGYSKGKK